MEDFIIFSNTCGGNTAIRKSEIAVIHEEDDDEEVTSVALKDGIEYDTHETFESIISKLTK